MQRDTEALFIGIDIGTSGVRAVAIDEMRQTHGDAACRMDQFGNDHRNPKIWLQCLEQVLAQLLKQIDVKLIKAISVDGTSGTTLAIDDKGVPLATPMMYNDPVSDSAILDSILEYAPKTSAVHGTNSALARAIKLQQIDGTKHIILQADWLAGQLSGKFSLSDANNTLKTGYDPVNGIWPQWISKTGMNVEMLPSVSTPSTPVAQAEGVLAKKIGLSKDVIIVSGTTDGCASFLATGAENTGDGVTVLGTTLTLKLLSDKPIFAPEYGIYSHLLPCGWLAGGASNSGGNVLEYFFSQDKIKQLSDKIDTAVKTGLDYYPLIKNGERFPYNDPDFKPNLEPRPKDDVKFIQGIFEGVSKIEALGYERLGELGAPKLQSMRTVGGGSKNTTWGEIRKTKLGVPFLEVLSGEAAAGTAYLALLGAQKAGLI